MQMSIRPNREILILSQKMSSNSLCNHGSLTGDCTSIYDENDSLRFRKVVIELVPDARVTWDIDKAHRARLLLLGRG